MAIQQDILKALGFESLTLMQSKMHERASQASGIVLLSPTGSGKTLAFLLPLVEQLNTSLDTLQAVVIVPTRELAQQIEDVLRSMKTSVRFVALYGGRPALQEHRVLKDVKPHVVIATPGRLGDHLRKGNVNAMGIKFLVIDEFDKCLELGFQEEMQNIVQQIKGIQKCWLMSATDSEEIPAFMNKVTPDFEKLDYSVNQEELQQRMEIMQVVSPVKDKLEILASLLNYIHGEPTIVFVAHRESVERVGDFLNSKGFYVSKYHGGMEQEIRERALYRFRNGSANVLISTDLAARGLDIPEVRAVIHYHLPLKPEEFTHRNGRTARWDSEGIIYMITGPEEKVPEYVESSEVVDIPETPLRIIPPRFLTIYIGRGKQDKLSKGDILGFLCKKGGLKSAEIGRIDVASHASYAAILRSKAKNVLKQIAGEKIKGMKTIFEETKKY